MQPTAGWRSSRVLEPLTREALSAFAEASGDMNPIHLDDAFAQRSGQDGVIVHGMLTLSRVVETVLAAFGPAATVRHLRVRFGHVLDVDRPLHVRAELSSWSDGPDGRVAHVHIAGGDDSEDCYVHGEMDVVVGR